MVIPEWQTQGGWLTFSDSQAYSRSVDSPRHFPSPSRVTGKTRPRPVRGFFLVQFGGGRVGAATENSS
jgi:hypothetical protein